MRPAPTLASTLLLLVLIGAGGSVAQELPAGSWAGSVVAAPPADPRALEVTLRREGDGFALRVASAGRRLLDGSFVPTARPGVYETSAGGLMSFFGRGATRNPLAGDELVWARRDGAGLAAYALRLMTADFDLLQLILTAEGDGLRATLRELRHGQPPLEASGLLTRKTG
jgi:hypothetical protein